MEQAAKEAVRAYLLKLNGMRVPVTTLSYEDAVSRAVQAKSFIDHPYWVVISRMLSGTIQSETEQLLASDEHRSVNRASVAICRKVLQAPFFDIEQGRMVEKQFEIAKAHAARKAKPWNAA